MEICVPKNDKKSTLQRQWEMMAILPTSRSESISSGSWKKASDITAELNANGYQVSVRTVQRDLKELAEIFPIELNDKNPRDYGWRWIKGATLGVPGMSIAEALAIGLVETHMQELLPLSMLSGLEGTFEHARNKLDSLNNFNRNHSKDWLDKVRVVPASQPLLPPHLEHSVQENIYQALLDNKQITANYKPINSDQVKEYLLHPLGLIVRGVVSYLVASAWNYQEVQLYALHRFKQVNILDVSVDTPSDFNLDRAIADGLAEFANQGRPIKLEFKCKVSVAHYLAETPLSHDQKISPEHNNWQTITATVNDTWQLRWWLLGQGASLEVCGPNLLRDEITYTMLETSLLYSKSIKLDT